MCGILGAVSPKIENAGEFFRFLNHLFVLSKSRGTDASGFAAFVDDKFITEKTDVASESFTKRSVSWRSIQGAKSISLVAHTRAYTRGHPTNNNNNHPHHGPRYSMVHNGGIFNFVEIAKKEGFDLLSNCDSELILHFLEKHIHIEDGIKETIGKLNKVSSMAVATLDRNSRDIHLFREDVSPCCIMTFPRWNATIFSSEMRIIVDAAARVLCDWTDVWDYADVAFEKTCDLPKFHHCIISPEGKISLKDLTEEIEFSSEYSRRTYSSGWSSYWDNNKYDSGHNDGLASYYRDKVKQAENARAAIESRNREESTNLENTAILMVCAECKKPIDDYNYKGPLAEFGNSWICKECIDSSSKLVMSIYSTKQLVKKFKNLIPDSLSMWSEDNQEILDVLTKAREPVEDDKLDDYNISSYIRYNILSATEKFAAWRNMSMNHVSHMGEGQYLAYTQFVKNVIEEIDK